MKKAIASNKTLITSILISIALIFTSPTHYSSAQTSTSTPISPDTQIIIKQLQALIISLQSQINELKVKLAATQKDVEIVKSEIQFTKALVRGTEGDEVKQLQEVLSKDPEIYPEGKVTGFFGPATEAAVKKFQEKYGIESRGTIGPKTRAKLNELITQGAGKSGVIPLGLEKRFGTTIFEQIPRPTIPSGTIPAQPVGQTGTTTATTTISVPPAISTTTPSLSPIPLIPVQLPPSVATSTTNTSVYDAWYATTPPIYNIVVRSISSTGAVINWNTKDVSNSEIHVATSPITSGVSFTRVLATPNSSKTFHEVVLSGSYSGTMYYFVVVATDIAGKTTTSNESSFVTLSSASSVAPAPSSSPMPSNTTTPSPSPSPVPLASCLSVDFEDDPYIGHNITNTPFHISWVNSKGLEITGTPSGYVWATQMSGGAGQGGVVIGFGSPDFLERDQGISDNEILAVAFLNQSFDSVTVTLASTPSSDINNQSSTVIMDAFDSVGTLLGSATKTFTGVTNGVYTPSTISLSVAQATIKKITLRTTQHPYGGVWIEKVACGISSSPSPTPSPTATPTDTTAPSTPTNLTATVASSTQINLSWTASTDNTGVSPWYKIYRNGVLYSSSGLTLLSLTYNDINLSPSTTYTYTVAAYDAAGNISAQSSSVSATTLSTTPPPPPPPPSSSLSAPTNLTGVNRNAWSIDLSWSAPSNATGITSYAIYRSTIHIADVAVNSSSFSDVNVAGNGNTPGGVTYTYYLKSYNGQNYSDSSNSVTITNTFTPNVACLSGTNNASLNYNTQGYVTTVDGNTFTDTCLDRTIIGQGVNLKKAYCDGNDRDPVSSRKFGISVVDCSYGCNAGTCNSTPVSMTTSISNLASVLAVLKSLSSLLQQLLSMWPI